MELSKNKINLYSRLGSRKQREKLGLFLAEGEKCVSDTLPFFETEAIIIMSDAEKGGMDAYAGLPVFTVSESDMRKISQLQSLPDVIAVYRMPAAKPLSESGLSQSISLLLDAVQDPGNLGTILRTASWFGIRQVILGTGCADPYNPKAVQSSMGAVGMIDFVQANLDEVIDNHPDIPVCGTLLDGRNIYDAPLSSPAFIVMGNEGNGLSAELRRRVTMPLLIPSYAEGPHAESLNVAAATAITLAEFMRKITVNS